MTSSGRTRTVEASDELPSRATVMFGYKSTRLIFGGPSDGSGTGAGTDEGKSATPPARPSAKVARSPSTSTWKFNGGKGSAVHRPRTLWLIIWTAIRSIAGVETSGGPRVR